MTDDDDATHYASPDDDDEDTTPTILSPEDLVALAAEKQQQRMSAIHPGAVATTTSVVVTTNDKDDNEEETSFVAMEKAELARDRRYIPRGAFPIGRGGTRGSEQPDVSQIVDSYDPAFVPIEAVLVANDEDDDDVAASGASLSREEGRESSLSPQRVTPKVVVQAIPMPRVAWVRYAVIALFLLTVLAMAVAVTVVALQRSNVTTTSTSQSSTTGGGGGGGGHTNYFHHAILWSLPVPCPLGSVLQLHVSCPQPNATLFPLQLQLLSSNTSSLEHVTVLPKEHEQDAEWSWTTDHHDTAASSSSGYATYACLCPRGAQDAVPLTAAHMACVVAFIDDDTQNTTTNATTTTTASPAALITPLLTTKTMTNTRNNNNNNKHRNNNNKKVPASAVLGLYRVCDTTQVAPSALYTLCEDDDDDDATTTTTPPTVGSVCVANANSTLSATNRDYSCKPGKSLLFLGEQDDGAATILNTTTIEFLHDTLQAKEWLL